MFAAAATAGQSPAAKERYRLAGVVVSARSGAPLKWADVQLRRVGGGATIRATTQVGGQFVFSNLEPGRYRLSADRRGFVPQEYGARAPGLPGETVDLQSGAPVMPLMIRLTPLGAIAGKVVDEEGEPVAEASIQALRYTFTPGGGRLTAARVTTTNDLGEYRLYGLRPGRYYISAENHLAGPREDSGAYAPTFFPGVTDPAGAAALELPAGGESLGADFSLQQARTVRVRGRVGNVPSGRSVRNVSVVLMPRTASGLGATFNRSAAAQEPGGTFQIDNVIPSSYVIAAYTAEQGARYTASQSIDVGNADLDGVELSLYPGVDLVGRVTSDPGSNRGPGGLTINLRPRFPSPTGGFTGRFKNDGALKIEGVAPGDYAVEISGVPEGLYVRSVRILGADALTSSVSVPGGRSTGELEVSLGTDGGRIDGRVTRGGQEPAASVQVVLVPEPGLRAQVHRYRSASTNAEGAFSLLGIAPGDYQLFVWEDLGEGNYLDPDFIRNFEQLGRAVKVPPNSRDNIELQLTASRTR